jgi:hypothetical protein
MIFLQGIYVEEVCRKNYFGVDGINGSAPNWGNG